MRKLAYFVVIIFFAVAAFTLFTVAMTVRNTSRIAAPVGEMVRDLVVPATAVVLPDPVVLVREVRDLARLETASVSLEKVIRAERDNERLWGIFGEEMLFVAHGEVIAGVDLAKMQEDDIQVVDPDTVMIHVPEAEIFNVVLDNEKSYVADRDKGFLASLDPQLETEVRRTAQRELLAAAEEAQILQRADANAEAYLRSFLQELGFENVIFTPATPPRAAPFEQEIPKGYELTTPVP